jgi:hypothetical protein
VRVRGLAKEVLAGAVGGLVGAGLMKITIPPAPEITASKELINRNLVGAGQTVTVKPSTNYKFAVILFHGNGDSAVEVRIQGDTTRTIRGNEQGIEVLANESITITASNSDSSTSRYYPTIEILSLSWS